MWCPTVSSGAFVARRNGQIFITGNSGFPKSHDISKALDREAGAERENGQLRTDGRGKWDLKVAREAGDTGVGHADGSHQHYFETLPATPLATQWQGYGTALKPAYEPVVLARAPRGSHTFAKLAREYGTGAINVDGGRVGTEQTVTTIKDLSQAWGNRFGEPGITYPKKGEQVNPPGRWPSNVILDEHAAVALDAQSGESGSGTYKPRSNNRTVMQFSPEHGWNQHSMNPNNANAPDDYGDVGGASRFFYTAKAAAWERTAGLPERSKHPTMKPIRLTEYLAKMLLPPIPARLLVPFSGVGSEMIGARLAGWDEIDGIEQDADYCVDAYNRVVWWSQFSSYEEAQKHYKQNKTDFGGWS